MIDSKGREWHVFEREDGSITVYYTRKGEAVHYVVFDSLNASQPSVQPDDCLLGGKHEWRTLSNGEYTKVVCGKCGNRR